MKLRHFLGLALPAVASACAAIVGFPDVPDEKDGGGVRTDAAGAPDVTTADGRVDSPPGDARTDTTKGEDAGPITGTEILYYVIDSTTTPFPVDFSPPFSVVAHVVEADGGITDYPGTGMGDGTFTVPGVPTGATYYIQVGQYPWIGTTPLFVYTSERAIDESVYRYGRTNVTLSDAGADADASKVVTTTVQYDINGNDSAYATVLSFGANATWLIGDAGNANATSTVSYDGGPDAYAISGSDEFYAGWPLINSSLGDITYVQGYFPVPDAGLDPAKSLPLAARQSFEPAKFVMTQGGTTKLTGTMTTQPVTKVDGGAMELFWDHGSFLSQAGKLSATGVIFKTELKVNASPSPALDGFNGASGTAAGANLYFETYSLATDLANTTKERVTLPYGDPFPGSWTRIVEADIYSRTVLTYPLPEGGTATTSTSGFIGCFYELSDVLGKTLQPTLGPATGVQVNGHSATTNQTGVGLEPVIAWEPPKVGVPTAYNVALEDGEPTPSGTGVTFQHAGSVTTPGSTTSIKLPKGILTEGHHYVISVSAWYGPNPSAPTELGPPSCIAATMSALIAP